MTANKSEAIINNHQITTSPPFERVRAWLIAVSIIFLTAGAWAAPGTVWVDDDYTATGPNDGHTWGVDAFATLQGGVDAVADGGTVRVAPGTYKGAVSAKSVNVKSTAPGVIIKGASPAWTQNGGSTTFDGQSFTVATDDPTVRVVAGTLTILNCTIDESTGFDQAAFKVEGGTLILTPGNTLNINGAGSFILNQGANAINAQGNTWKQDGAAISDNFTIEDEILHQLDNSAYGLVTWVANNVYVTAASGAVQRGITSASAGFTVNVGPGTYVEAGQIVLSKNLKIVGSGSALTTLKTDSNTTLGGNVQSEAWVYLAPATTLDLSALTLDASGYQVHHALQSRGTLSLNDCVIKNVKYGDYYGRGIVLYTGTAGITNVTMSNIERIGVHVRGGVVLPAPAAIIAGLNYTGKGPGAWLDYAIEAGAGGVAEVYNSTITGCEGVAGDGSTSAGVLATTYFGPGTAIKLLGNTITGNTDAVVVGYDTADTSKIFLQANNLTGNSNAGISITGGSVDAGQVGGVDITGFGISTGDNNLTGYGADELAPWAIESPNAAVVKAFNNNYGNFANVKDVVSDTPGSPVGYSQSGAAYAIGPANLTVECVGGVPPGAVTLADFLAQGGVFSATVATSVSVTSGAITPGPTEGTITRSYTLVDLAGQTANSSQIVTVDDTTPPTITCPPNQTVVADSGICSASGVSLGTPTTGDNCGVASVGNNAPSTFPVGNTTVTWTVTDINGLTATCSQTVTVLDSQPPSLACKNISLQLNASGVASITPADVHQSSSDNCGPINLVSVVPNSFTYCNLGENPVVLTINDSHGNTVTCNATVTITAPETPALVYVDDNYTTTCGPVTHPAAPGTLYVGFNAFNTVEAALAAVAPGGVIHVADGTYSTPPIAFNKAVTIEGQSQAGVIVTATGAGAANNYFDIVSPSVVLKKLTIDGAVPHYTSWPPAKPFYGLNLGGATPTGIALEDVTVKAFGKTGINLNGVTGVTVTRVTSRDNGGAGFFALDVHNITFDSIVTENNQWGGIGIGTWGRYYPAGVSGVVFTGTSDLREGAGFQGGLYLEEGNYADKANPVSITYGTTAGVNVQLASGMFTHTLHGPQDDGNPVTSDGYRRIRFYSTRTDAVEAALQLDDSLHVVGPGHFLALDTRYVRDLADGSFYVPNGLTIQAAVAAAPSGSVINLADGTYTLATTLAINKSLTLSGESQAGVVINAAACGASWGIWVTADNTTLQNFTVQPPILLPNNGGYAVHVSPPEPLTTSSTKVNDITLRNITVTSAHRTPFDLHGVDGGLLEGLTATGSIRGNGISLTACDNIVLRSCTTGGNAWGGLAIYSSAYLQDGSSNITIEPSCTFNETRAVYSEPGAYTLTGLTLGDPYYSVDFGGGNISYANSEAQAVALASGAFYAGYPSVVRDPSGALISFDTSKNLVQVDDDWVGLPNGAPVTVAGTYYTIGANASATLQGGVSVVNLAGTVSAAPGSYAAVVVSKSVTLLGADAATACGGSQSVINGGAGTAVTIAANDVTVKGFELQGAIGLSDTGFAGAVVQNNKVTTGALGIQMQGIVGGFTLRDNCVILGAQVAGSNPTVGILLAGLSGAVSTVENNTVTGAFYGYLATDVQAAAPTVISGGSISSVMQGVAILNTMDFSTFKPSTITVDGITMSGFSGNYPASPNNNFHAGVYAYTGGSDSAAKITAVVKNLNISGTGKIQGDCAALNFSDFSTVSGSTMQDITVEACALANNLNRGINIRGANAEVDITRCTLSNNGFDPIGTGGNDGFGLIARVSAKVTVTESFITNPSAQVGFTVTALLVDADPTVTVSNCSINNNGNTAGKLAMVSSGTLNASGNWWGGIVDSTIAGLMLGDVDFTPYLQSGTDTDSVLSGFQGSFSDLHVTLLGTQVGATGRIQEAINLVSGSTVNISAGIYNEYVDVNKYVRLIGAGSTAAGTVLRSGTGGSSARGIVQLSASGTAGSPILLQDLRLEPVGLSGISVGLFTQPTGLNVDYVTLQNLQVIGTGLNPCTEQERGLYVDHTSTLRHLVVESCSFDNLHYGWYFQKAVSADSSTVSDVSVSNTTFVHNSNKGIYAEKLSNATFTCCTISQNGYNAALLGACTYFTPWLSGVDINLKAGTYANLVFQNSDFTQNALGGAAQGVALAVKARGTGTDTSYAGFPATLTGVTIQSCRFDGNERGLRIGEPGKAHTSPTAVTVSLCSFTGSTTGIGIINELGATAAVVDADNNWWGNLTGPTHATNPGATGQSVVGVAVTDFSPWLGDSTDTSAACGFQPNATPVYSLPASLAFSNQPGGAVEGAPFTQQPTVTVLNDLGAPATQFTQPITIAIGVNPTTGILSGDTLKNAAAGVAGFNTLAISEGGSAYTLVASTPGLPSVSSAAFEVGYQAPVLASMTPSWKIVNSGSFVITLTGANFANASEVRWNGTALPRLTWTETQMTATVDNSLIAAAGTASVTVFTPTPAGGESAALTFNTYIVPPVVWVDDNFDSGNTDGHIWQYDAFNKIQDGVNAVAAAGTVNVAAGVYLEDLNVNKQVNLLGAGLAQSTISGAIGGDGATVRLAASGIVVDGFTITREGNNPTDWNNPALNSAGAAIQGQALTGITIRRCKFEGNRTGVDINNSNGHTLTQNLIVNNRTGLIMRNQTDNLSLTENEITGNWTVGVLFLDASSGSNVPVQTAANSLFNNNNISGNWYGQIVDRQTGGSLPPAGSNLKNFSGNWLGTTTPVVSTANSAEPGYAAQIPVIYGGTAVPPTTPQPDICGAASANIDYTPWLNAGTDTQVATTGFQGDFSALHVNASSAQTGSSGRIQEGIDLVTASTVYVHSGTYTEGPQILINKNLSLVGDGIATTLVTPAGNTAVGGNLPAEAWVYVQPAIAASISGISFDGAGKQIHHAIQSRGDLTMSSCEIKNIRYTTYMGRGIVLYGGSSAINNCVFSNIERIGIHVRGNVMSPAPVASITGCTYTGKGAIDCLDYAVEIGGGGQATVTGLTATACLGTASVDGSTSAGVLATDYWGTGTTLKLVNSTLSGNTAGVVIGYGGTDSTKAMLQGNDLSGNTDAGLVATGTPIIDAGDLLNRNLTGLGSSTGGNNLSGYGFNNAAPWAIDASGATGGQVVGYANEFGATVAQDINQLISDGFDGAGMVTVAFSEQGDLTSTAPAAVTVECAAGIPAAATTLTGYLAQLGVVSASPVTIASTDTTYAGFPIGDGVVTRAYTLTDEAGRTVTVNQAITVDDTTAPTITCPAPVTVNANAGICFATGVSLGTPTTSDNCGVASVVNNGPASYPVGNTTVTWTVTDNSGLTATCEQLVTVIDNQVPVVTQGAINPGYTTQAAAEAAAVAATSATDNCGVATTAAISTVGTCSAVITVRVTDVNGQFTDVTYNTRIDGTAPAIGTIAAAQTQAGLPVSVLNGAAPVYQGTVNLSVVASDACWTATDHPVITLVNGATTETATFVNESPAGTYNYTWAAGAATANGTWTGTVAANDLASTSTATFTLNVDKTQVTGQLTLQSFQGTGTNVNHSRLVRFVATTGATVLKTWDLVLTNASGDTFSYTLTGVPAGTTGLSAKTEWNLRRKLSLTLDGNGQGTADFTGATNELKGGDIAGAGAAPAYGPPDNAVQLYDYLVLLRDWQTFTSQADLDGNGRVSTADYNILSGNWYKAGDPE